MAPSPRRSPCRPRSWKEMMEESTELSTTHGARAIPMRSPLSPSLPPPCSRRRIVCGSFAPFPTAAVSSQSVSPPLQSVAHRDSEQPGKGHNNKHKQTLKTPPPSVIDGDGIDYCSRSSVAQKSASAPPTSSPGIWSSLCSRREDQEALICGGGEEVRWESECLLREWCHSSSIRIMSSVKCQLPRAE